MADSERIGPYRVIRRLGVGGMGEVLLAHDDRLDRLVAIKRLHDDHAATPERRERFRREAKIAARLNHPAIVQIHDVLQQGAFDYLIMEYVEGRTLRARCDAGPMTVSEVLGIAHQIALGMAAAHDLGVIHRDLKAENILLTAAGRAKITDFGIAKLRGEDTITAKGAVVGTFRAMSPEQALGHAIDHRSDLFSFGILLYEVLAGVSPFRADTPFLTVQRLVRDDPQPITELVPSIPSGLASLIHQLLAKEPMLRPRDFHEVADALIELAGQACDAPCHAGLSPGGGLPSSGEDTQSTGDRPAPVRPWTAGALAAAGGSGTPAPPSRKIVSGLEDTAVAPTDPLVLPVAAPPDRSAPLDTGDHVSTLARPGVARRRLPWYAAAVGITVIGSLGIVYAVRGEIHSGGSVRAPLLRVAVLAPSFPDAADRPDVALLATSVRNAVMIGVRARTDLDLVPRDDIDGYVEGFKGDAGHRPAQHAIQSAVGADELIATHIECLPSSCKVTLERWANTPGSPSPESFQLSADSTGHPGDTVAVHLASLYPDHPVRDAAAVGSIDPRDHERYVRLVQDYWAGHNALSTDQLLVEIEGIRARSPRSLDVLLFEADVLRHSYVQTEDPNRARRAISLLADADQLFPDTYGILSARFDILLTARRIDDARVILDRLVVLDPDSSATHLQRAKLHWKCGELDQARGELDAAVRRDSFSWRVLYYRAQVSKKQGDRGATRAAIDQLIERSPGNYAGLSLRANEDLDVGRLACAEQGFARLVAREPLYYECLNLGYVRSLLGRYHEALEGYHCALAARPDDPAPRLDVAESLLLAGNASDAGEQFRALRALLVQKRARSPAGKLEEIDRLVEAQTLAYLGRDDPARAADARARVAELVTPTAQLRVFVTAALVHAILGDRALAARYVAQYLDRGGAAAKLSDPWFDDLRKDPVLGPRLAVAPVARTCEDGSAP